MDTNQAQESLPKEGITDAEVQQRRLKDAQLAVQMALDGKLNLAIQKIDDPEEASNESQPTEAIEANDPRLEEARQRVQDAYDQAA